MKLADLVGHPLARYRACSFPARWAADLRRKVFQVPDEDDDGYTVDGQPRAIPLWAVNNAIAALMPRVLTHDGRGHCDRAWLAYAPQEQPAQPDIGLLVEFVRGGLLAAAHHRNTKAIQRGRKPVVDLDALAAVTAGFHSDDISFQDYDLDIGPGKPIPDGAYTMVPHMLATHLLGSGWAVEHSHANHDGETIRDGVSNWRRTANRDGAELISVPTPYITGRGTSYYWSYTARLSLRTIPLDPHSYVHVHLGMRRWARTNVFDATRTIGVHLFTGSPWGDVTSPIGIASMRWQPGPRGTKTGRMVWNDDLAPTLARLTSTTDLPEVTELAKNPRAFLELGVDRHNKPIPPIAGVVFRYGLGDKCKHSVGDGVSAHDRWQIFRHLYPALCDFATKVEPYHRINVKTRHRPDADEFRAIDHRALAAATAPAIHLDLRYDTAVIRKAVLLALEEALDLTFPSSVLDAQDPNLEYEFHRPRPELDVTIRVAPVGELAADLPIDSSIRNTKDRIAQAAAPRRDLARAQFAPTEDIRARFAIIEMRGPDAFPTPEHDPKKPVKAAAAACGALTKNITPPKPLGRGDGRETESGRTERARKTVADLFIRQTGLLEPMSTTGTADNPLNKVATVGLWVVRRNGQDRAVLPLAVGWLPDEPFARLRLPNCDRWVPYREGLLALGSWDTDRVFTHERVREFFTTVVAEAGDGTDTALLTLAQNIRPACPGIADGHLQEDTLAFDPDSPIPLHDRKGIRHLRLRTNLRSETSQHYTCLETDPDLVGHGSSLWDDPRNPRRFLSTPDKPNTAGPGSPQGSRISPHYRRVGEEEWGWVNEITKKVWNPRLLEILVAAQQPDDNTRSWAALAHQQRYAARHYAEPLILPIVLHLASKVDGYILPPDQVARCQAADE
ncbi:RNaseH domain-containing protein [Amycolatopsis sp. NPDC059090]|uniref:RNaseH domain-containing protein n=1 Tax=unclassified Amycolatopsis TaxID=2618356 RepID=UPI00366BEF17